MSLPILYVTDDLTRWGPSTTGGRLVSAAEFDRNNWTFDQAIEAVQTALLEVAGSRTTAISTRPGSTALTFSYADGTSLEVPFTPILQRFKGEWAPGVAFDQLDFFTVNETGFFVSLVPHISAATFDAAALDDDGNPLYKFLIRYSQLSDLVDVDWTSPVDHDVPVWNSLTGKLENKRPRYILSPSVKTSGAMTASDELFWHDFSIDVTIPANFGPYLGHLSKARCRTASSGDATLLVEKASAGSPDSFATIGTITFFTGNKNASLATAGGSAINYAGGDILRVSAPASADATLADIFATLVGFET